MEKTKLSDICKLAEIDYADERLVLTRKMRNIPTTLNSLQVCLAMLVTSGSATIQQNGKMHKASKGHLFIGYPNAIWQTSEVSSDFEFCGICMSMEYIMQITTNRNNALNVRFVVDKTPFVELEEDEVESYLAYYDTILSKLHNSKLRHARDIAEHYIHAFMLEVCDIFLRRTEMQMGITSATNIYTKFMHLLEESTPPERRLDYYAKELNITTKYLTMITKQCCGLSASRVVDQNVIKRATTMLLDSSLTIKQISIDLGFPNQSFFGKFFKKNTGHSPQKYRANHI